MVNVRCLPYPVHHDATPGCSASLLHGAHLGTIPSAGTNIRLEDQPHIQRCSKKSKQYKWLQIDFYFDLHHHCTIQFHPHDDQELDSARCSSHSSSRFITTSLLDGHSTSFSPLSQCASHGRSSYHHHYRHHHHHVQMIGIMRSWKIEIVLIILIIMNDVSKYFNKTIFWRKIVVNEDVANFENWWVIFTIIGTFNSILSLLYHNMQDCDNDWNTELCAVKCVLLNSSSSMTNQTLLYKVNHF